MVTAGPSGYLWGTGMSELIEVELARVVLQEKGDQQFLHMRERGGERSFPIVIGFAEAAEINRKLRNAQMPRPMTHDLIGKLLETLGWSLDHIVIHDLRETTFYALLVLRQIDVQKIESEKLVERSVDCRPSDAIALAVQVRCKMFVARKVLDAVAPA